MNARPLLLAAALVGLLSSGCAKNSMTLEPYAICAMPDNCTFSGECSAYALGAIAYRPAAHGYGTPAVAPEWLQFGVELRNQKINNADFEVGRVNSNDAHVTGVILEIDGPTSTSIELDVGHQTVPADGTAVVWTYVLPPSTIVALAAGTYVVNVAYVGFYDNGDEFETPGFPIAVEVQATATPFDFCGYVGVDVVQSDCGTNQQSLMSCP